MIFSKGLVIHASGRVRIDTIDHQGIFKPEKNGYSHKLRIIRRISDPIKGAGHRFLSSEP